MKEQRIETGVLKAAIEKFFKEEPQWLHRLIWDVLISKKPNTEEENKLSKEEIIKMIDDNFDEYENVFRMLAQY